jgi:hypothetical protein
MIPPETTTACPVTSTPSKNEQHQNNERSQPNSSQQKVKPKLRNLVETNSPARPDEGTSQEKALRQVSCIPSGTIKTTKHYDPAKIIERIRTDKALLAKVASIQLRFLRALKKSNGDRKKAKAVVSKSKLQLPAVLWSGTFESAAAPVAEKLIQHSGLLCADLDGLGKTLHEVRVKLLESPHLWTVFLSPSGDGLKAIFRVPADKNKHKASFRAVEKHVRELTGVQIDESCSDVGRLCFLSHDPDAYTIDGAVELPPLEEPGEPGQPEPDQNDSSGQQGAPRSPRAVAEKLLGEIDWENENEGFCTCPGKHLHTSADNPKDCKVWLDTVAIQCFHNSCKGIVAGVSREFRARIAVAEEEPTPPAAPAEKGMQLPEVFSILDLETPIADDPNTLLGDRFLCRGGGLLISGPMHSGKSTLLIQLAMHWAIGRACLDIKPVGPLKILYIQAENDQGDMAEMRDGTAACLGEISDSERATLRKNFIGATIHYSGKKFIATVAALLRLHKADLVMIDPALSYIGGDGSEQAVVGQFLRNNLDPVLHEHGCAAIVAHHHNKPSKESGRKMLDYEHAYLAAGSAEWANWPRASLSLIVKDNHGLREIICGKRDRKLGWKGVGDVHTAKKLVRMGDRVFTELSAEEAIAVDSKADPMDKALRTPGILPLEGESIEKQTLIARMAGREICGARRALDQVIPLLIDEGYLEEKEVPRTNARAAIHLARTSKQPNRVSFK